VTWRAEGPVAVVTIARPEVKNAVDRATADALADALRRFEADDLLAVAVLSGEGGTFCAGADLKAFAEGRGNRLEDGGDGPMGLSRMLLSKPMVAAIEGYCLAGGLELAALCDLRVAAEDAILGVACRRFGVPLIDGGTVRLPRLIGMSRALDLILTGREVSAREALAMGLVNRVVASGTALAEAVELASQLARFPQTCLRQDRLSTYEQADLDLSEALANEFMRGKVSLASPELEAGVARFLGRARRPS
jgi:enoyl-CoA hydratase